MGRTCSMDGRFGSQNLREIDHLVDQGKDGKVLENTVKIQA